MEANAYKGGKSSMQKLKPSLDSIRTCRAIQEDATIILGVFDPNKYIGPGPARYKSYPDIRGLIKGKYRSIILLKTREGQIEYPDNEVPICCYFARDDFEELPHPKDRHEMERFFHASAIPTADTNT